MQTTLPLDKMSTLDKLRALEEIWNDLLKRSEELPMPEWHGDVLAAREKRIQAGTAKFTDWVEAKKSLHNKL